MWALLGVANALIQEKMVQKYKIAGSPVVGNFQPVDARNALAR